VQHSIDEIAVIPQRGASGRFHLLHGKQTAHHITCSDSHYGRSIARHLSRNGHSFLRAHAKISNAESVVRWYEHNGQITDGIKDSELSLTVQYPVD
jgi:hypothetical protein